MDFEIRRKGFVNLYRIICSNESDFSLIKDVDSIAGLLANVVTQYQSIVIKEFASVESNDDDMVSTDVEEMRNLVKLAHPKKTKTTMMTKMKTMRL